MQDLDINKEVLHSLEQVLNTNDFRAAPKMSAFLSYVVMQTLNGNASSIRAYTVAVNALGKPTNFDPKTDPCVRVLAHRLRKKLALYHEISSDYNIEIKIGTGGYVPVFICVAKLSPHTENQRTFIA